MIAFIRSSSGRELDAQTDLPNPDPIDKIDYELEIELATDKTESESIFEDDAPDQLDAISAKNKYDFFEFFFRLPPRLAIFDYGNYAYTNRIQNTHVPRSDQYEAVHGEMAGSGGNKKQRTPTGRFAQEKQTFWMP